MGSSSGGPSPARRVTTSDDPGSGGEADHIGERPSWSCRVCAEPWPCVAARSTLAAGADRVMLTIYLWGHLDHAMTDLPAEAPADLFDRFLGWAGAQPALA